MIGSRFILLTLALMVPAVASADRYEEFECSMLVRDGDRCLEWTWMGTQYATEGESGPGTFFEFTGVECPANKKCECTRQRHHGFDAMKRAKYYYCRVRY